LRKIVRIKKAHADKLPEDIKNELYILCSSEKVRNLGELVTDIKFLSKLDQTDFSLEEAWNARRQCDKMFDSEKMAKLEDNPEVTLADLKHINSQITEKVSEIKRMELPRSFSEVNLIDLPDLPWKSVIMEKLSNFK
jgi:hypothetical protein